MSARLVKRIVYFHSDVDFGMTIHLASPLHDRQQVGQVGGDREDLGGLGLVLSEDHARFRMAGREVRKVRTMEAGLKTQSWEGGAQSQNNGSRIEDVEH